jgi:hypothetical protein
MYYQTVHERPTVTGHVSRPPEGAYAFIETHPLLASLWENRRPVPGAHLSADAGWLADAGVRYVVVHRHRMGDEEWETWQSYADVAPVFVGDGLVVYCTEGVR